MFMYPKKNRVQEGCKLKEVENLGCSICVTTRSDVNNLEVCQVFPWKTCAEMVQA